MALFSFFCLVSLVLFMCMYFIIVCALREHKARSSCGSSGSGRKTPANRSSDTRVFSIRIRRGRSSRLSLGKYKFLCGAHCLSQVEETVAYLTNEVACVDCFRLHFASATKGDSSFYENKKLLLLGHLACAKCRRKRLLAHNSYLC